jgi:hypothetical protein
LNAYTVGTFGYQDGAGTLGNVYEVGTFGWFSAEGEVAYFETYSFEMIFYDTLRVGLNFEDDETLDTILFPGDVR